MVGSMISGSVRGISFDGKGSRASLDVYGGCICWLTVAGGFVLTSGTKRFPVDVRVEGLEVGNSRGINEDGGFSSLD